MQMFPTLRGKFNPHSNTSYSVQSPRVYVENQCEKLSQLTFTANL